MDLLTSQFRNDRDTGRPPVRSAGSASILVVDDEEPIRKLLTQVLKRGGYQVIHVASSTDEAREILSQKSVDIMLTDMHMPGGSGMDLLAEGGERLELATLMVTATDDSDLADQAMSLGAYGYIIKPFKRNEVLNNVNSALRRRQLEIVTRAHREELEVKVRARTSELWTALQTLEQRSQELKVSYEETVERLSIAAEFRDKETAIHIRRMSRFCQLLSGWAGQDRERTDLVRLASTMHDVGKIGIPDDVLLKPGKLTSDEFALMQEHTEFGFRILSGSSSELLKLAATIALTHHEKCDGSGYPAGLKKEDIPLEGRIAAIADVFDALTTNRVYRKSMGLYDAVEIMKQGRGSHFDPELLDAFLSHLDEVLRVKKEEDDRLLPT